MYVSTRFYGIDSFNIDFQLEIFRPSNHYKTLDVVGTTCFESFDGKKMPRLFKQKIWIKKNLLIRLKTVNI